MVLTPKALKLINNPKTSIKLAIAVDCSVGTIIRYIPGIKDDLTKAAAVKVIKQETGIHETRFLKR